MSSAPSQVHATIRTSFQFKGQALVDPHHWELLKHLRLPRTSDVDQK